MGGARPWLAHAREAEQLGTCLWGTGHRGLRGKERGRARGRGPWRRSCQKRSSSICNSRCSRDRGPVFLEWALIRIGIPHTDTPLMQLRLPKRAFLRQDIKVHVHVCLRVHITSLPDSAGGGHERRLVLTSRDERRPSSRWTNLRLNSVTNRLRNASRHFACAKPNLAHVRTYNRARDDRLRTGTRYLEPVHVYTRTRTRGPRAGCNFLPRPSLCSPYWRCLHSCVCKHSSGLVKKQAQWRSVVY